MEKPTASRACTTPTGVPCLPPRRQRRTRPRTLRALPHASTRKRDRPARTRKEEKFRPSAPLAPDPPRTRSDPTEGSSANTRCRAQDRIALARRGGSRRRPGECTQPGPHELAAEPSRSRGPRNPHPRLPSDAARDTRRSCPCRTRGRARVPVHAIRRTARAPADSRPYPMVAAAAASTRARTRAAARRETRPRSLPSSRDGRTTFTGARTISTRSLLAPTRRDIHRTRRAM